MTKEEAKVILEDGESKKYTDEELEIILSHLTLQCEIIDKSYKKKKNERQSKEKI